MSWIKRNLYFVIGSVVALALMGLAGWFLYSQWMRNNEILNSLNTDYETLRTLNNQNPHPGNDKIDNIKKAKEQQKELRDFVQRARGHFLPIPRIPDEPKITDHDFFVALSRTVDQLQKDATNASVALPASYNFSFEAEKAIVVFVPGSLEPLAVQLGEVKTICDVLVHAKVNAIDSIRRVRVSADDAKGPQTDYLLEKSVTNDLAVLTPYELTFRCFSSELAAILGSFASSPHGLIVKTVNVEVAPAAATIETLSPTLPVPTYIQPFATPTPSTSDSDARQAFLRRYGLNRYSGRGGEGGTVPGGVPLRDRTIPAPQPVYAPAPLAQPGAGTTGKGGLATVLDERLMRITMNLTVVKLLAKKGD